MQPKHAVGRAQFRRLISLGMRDGTSESGPRLLPRKPENPSAPEISGNMS